MQIEMEERVQRYRSDAAKFENYGDYNVFFLFNPFAEPIMEKAVDQLLKISEKKEITVIYHHPVYIELFREKADLTMMREVYDKVKGYYTYIFSMQSKNKS